MLWSPISFVRSLTSVSSAFAAFAAPFGVFSATVDLHQMGDDPDLPLQLGRVRALDGLADPTEPQSGQCRFLRRVRAGDRSNLLDLDPAHEPSPSFEASSALGSSAAVASASCAGASSAFGACSAGSSAGASSGVA